MVIPPLVGRLIYNHWRPSLVLAFDSPAPLFSLVLHQSGSTGQLLMMLGEWQGEELDTDCWSPSVPRRSSKQKGQARKCA